MSEGLHEPIEPLNDVVRIADVEFSQYVHPVRGTRLVVQSLCDFRLMGRGPL